MGNLKKSFSQWENLRIGITGANGSLGTALTKTLRKKGAFVIGLTSKAIDKSKVSKESPNEWIQWKCGEEEKLDKTLELLDIIILNHGINHQDNLTNNKIDESLEINSLSTWRIINRFEMIVKSQQKKSHPREIWVNTSEAEIQPALSPAYEISKRLIGQFVTLKWSKKNKDKIPNLNIRKLVLGPFRSELNPLGIMSANLVADQIIKQVEMKLNLIVVSPNPLTYIAMPLVELIRILYYKTTINYK
tara:strand:- start:1733 stop:2473 length:741 start_codon:yes stop_codon:yes gene_type:complete